MTPPPPPSMPRVDQITLVCDYPAGNVILVRFPNGPDLTPAALIALLAATADCTVALGAARADAAALRIEVEKAEARVARYVRRSLELQVMLLTTHQQAETLFSAADAWARAIAEPNGVDDAEKALVKAVEVWREALSPADTQC